MSDLTSTERSSALVRLLARRPAAPMPSARPTVIARGLTDRGIARLIRLGEWTALSPGRYVPSGACGPASGEDRHRALIAGLVSDLTADTVVSHVSAAVVLGIPLWGSRLDRVHVSRVRDGGARSSRWLRPHTDRGPIPAVTIDGVQVTAPARTVVDCARLLPFEQGVIVADGALYAEIVTAADLQAEIEAAARKKGIGRARAVVAFADGRSESVGESRSRVMLAASRLPAMELQYVIRDERGLFVARVDFAIPELRVAGEFDGKTKYGRLLRLGESAGDVVFKEKVREDAVRDLDWQMVRWVWEEIETPQVVVGRWDRAIRRAQRSDSRV